jgi:tetratricopeptide (TPR) repeat protein
LDRNGDVEQYLKGNFKDALAYYMESLLVRERLIELFGPTRAFERNLSVSLANLGDLHQYRLGNSSLAKTFYAKCIEIDSRIVAVYGQTPESLTDLSASIWRFSKLEEFPCIGLKQAFETIRRRNDLFDQTDQSSQQEQALLAELRDYGCE